MNSCKDRRFLLALLLFEIFYLISFKETLELVVFELCVIVAYVVAGVIVCDFVVVVVSEIFNYCS